MAFPVSMASILFYPLLIHDKYELSLTEVCRGSLSNTAMGTLIRISNVCLSYWKNEVVSFFQDIR